MKSGRNVALTAAGLAVVASGWFGYSWWSAAADDDIQRGVARDEVLRAGEQAITTFNSLDYRHVDRGYQRWLRSSTGALHDELARDPEGSKQQIEQAGSITRGTVLDAAVREVDEATGTAKIIASVRIDVTPKGKKPVTKQNRFQAEMKRTDSGWKISQLAPVPVGES